jgi:nicotinamidase-related amidase
LITVEGKEVFTELSELVDPAHTALLLVDMQHDFVESDARDALFNDLYVVIAVDCVASDDREQHDASLLLMRHRFDMVIADEIAAVWATARRRAGDEG